MNALSDGRTVSPLVTDANWHAVRACRERNCVRVMTAAHWDAINLCDRALCDYSDHEAWSAVIEASRRSKP